MAPRQVLSLGLATAGVALSSYLSYVAFSADVEPLCTGIGDCAAVQQSSYSRVAGLPVATWGLGMYLAIVILLLAGRAFRDSAKRRVLVWAFALALGGTLYSAYLTYLELFVIRAICIWCVASAAIVTGICILTIRELRLTPVRD